MTAALLKITYANGAFEERAFADGSYEIGRDSGAIVLNDAGVSARHARVGIGNGQVWLSELGASSVMLLPPPGATVGMPQDASGARST